MQDYYRKQFEYYINKLLTFKQYVKLKDICALKRGKRVTKSELKKEKGGEYIYPVYHGSLKPTGYFNKYNCKRNTTIIIHTGCAGDIGYSKEPYWLSDNAYSFINTLEITQKYLYYFLDMKKQYLKTKIVKAAVPVLHAEEILNLELILPSLEEQNEKTAILDQILKKYPDIENEINYLNSEYEYCRNKFFNIYS